MKRKAQQLILIIILLVSITACSQKTVKVTESMNNQTVQVDKGHTIEISLPGNPTTGYNWEIKNIDQSILKQSGDLKFTSDDTVVVGSGGTITLQFKAVGSGKTQLELVYRRSWEKDVPALETFTLWVEVK